MNEKKMARWIRAAVVGFAVCGAAVPLYFVPVWGWSMVLNYPSHSHYYVPWLSFIWVAALPCIAALILVWKISVRIRHGHSFCDENAKMLRAISVMAFCDAAFVLVGNMVFVAMNISHPGIVLWVLLIIVAGVGCGLTAAALSRLVQRAADLQQLSDETV